MSIVDRRKNKYWVELTQVGKQPAGERTAILMPDAKITLQCNIYGYARMMAMDMARGPNQILPRKGMYIYKPCLT